ncbi:MAG: GNAT family N-acetyltransferase [bacterium]|nr:GNAT family N-acetyltransferase [bacterium]
MKIAVLKRKSKVMKAFDKAGWKHYDQEHFGKDIEWNPKIYFLKAFIGGKILGTLELKINGGVGEIKTLLVEHTTLRRGVGKALMLKAEEMVKAHGGHKLFLTAGEGWQAVKFYEALGFEETGKLPNHYFNVDFIEMSKFV